MRYLFFLLVVCCWPACRPADPGSPARQYLFLGHPYNWNDQYRVDPRVERLDLESFDQIWLGGDVCGHTTAQPSTLHYLDTLFGIRRGRVHWAWGNHDILDGHEERISQTTGRPSFYTAWVEGVCLVVLNTNLFWFYEAADPPAERCAEKEAQVGLLRRVTDTVQAATHLVVLHHHALLTDLKPDSLRDAFNINPRSVRTGCDPASGFSEEFLSRFQAVQERGVQVLLVGGDVGMRAKRFAWQTPDGIWLLGSGINNSLPPELAPEYVTTFDPDQVLIFQHRPETGELTWQFVLLDDL